MLSQDWNGDIALFPYTDKELTEIYRTDGFNDFFGTPFDSVINFTYYPKKGADLKPYVELRKSTSGAGQEGQGYNQFTRRCFIDFVIKHTDADLIISDARNPKSEHILSKPEFGFTSATNDTEILPYSKGMKKPYILFINRS